MSKHALALPADYTQWLAALKQRINGARQQALLAVNQEHIRLYHDSREILERQNQQGWEPESLTACRPISVPPSPK